MRLIGERAVQQQVVFVVRHATCILAVALAFQSMTITRLPVGGSGSGRPIPAATAGGAAAGAAAISARALPGALLNTAVYGASNAALDSLQWLQVLQQEGWAGARLLGSACQACSKPDDMT